MCSLMGLCARTVPQLISSIVFNIGYPRVWFVCLSFLERLCIYQSRACFMCTFSEVSFATITTFIVVVTQMFNAFRRVGCCAKANGINQDEK